MFTQDHLQELLSFYANGTPVVSMYLDTDCSQQSAETVKLQVKGLLRELNGANEQDAVVIERFLDHSYDWTRPGLALFSCAPSDFFKAYNALTNADMKFPDAVDSEGNVFEVGQSSINSLITHSDSKVRQTAFDHYADGYLNQKNTIASIQVGGIHRDIFNARTRNYPSSLEASLSPNDIPPAVFHALIDTFD